MKSQRIRDPIHNLIEFDKDEFEQTLWQVIQTLPFQRLRRVRQLGFSELVFPGATHTRFAHSIGVFHTARQLMQVIKQHLQPHSQFSDHQSRVALAAALLHDVGHGMFSHAFEKIGKELNLAMARHEDVSEKLIREGEVSEALRPLGSGFACDVADVLKRKEPNSLYDTVVSSQFDADRLDYMQRDRLMTGVQSSGIDATWLLANLEIASVNASADDDKSRTVETLVLGPKAFHAAENYVLSLFQLYPNVYFHKTTRGAEKLFAHMLLRIISLVLNNSAQKTGLADNHPICRFARQPDSLENALALDDNVFWGALPMMVEAQDRLIRYCATSLRHRCLPKCVDIRRYVEDAIPIRRGMNENDRKKRDAEVRLACKQIVEKLKEAGSDRNSDEYAIFIDTVSRPPYKRFQESKTQLNQILIKRSENACVDMAHLSAVVASSEAFEVCRAYHMEGDTEGLSMIENIIRTKLSEGKGHG